NGPKSELKSQGNDRQNVTFLQFRLLQIAENHSHIRAVGVLNRRLIKPKSSDIGLMAGNSSP
ncbi:MAG: hypothetical protein QGF46_07930, partial [Planctomycetota bacterium]|nr:hypothetical protein [Planctomycetota bacterium]